VVVLDERTPPYIGPGGVNGIGLFSFDYDSALCLKSRLWRDAPQRRSLLLKRSGRFFALFSTQDSALGTSSSGWRMNVKMSSLTPKHIPHSGKTLQFFE